MPNENSTAQYQDEDNTTCFYFVIYKKQKDSPIEISRRFLSRKNALESPAYQDSVLKRIIRLEASEGWLKNI